MVEIKEALKIFGLTEHEVEIYLVLLKLGSSPASKVVENTGIHRINVYDILDRLIERGLVSSITSENRKLYSAAGPEKILEMENERRGQIEQIIPELMKQKECAKGDQDVSVFEGEAIKNQVRDITKSKKIEVISSGSGLLNYAGASFFENIHVKMKENKTKVRFLTSNRKAFLPDPLEVRYLPEDFVIPSGIIIYDECVLTLVWRPKPLAILIKSKDVYDSYLNFFNMLWKMSEK